MPCFVWRATLFTSADTILRTGCTSNCPTASDCKPWSRTFRKFKHSGADAGTLRTAQPSDASAAA
eukprot:4095897-Pyramimonas_sp.AAC.1